MINNISVVEKKFMDAKQKLQQNLTPLISNDQESIFKNFLDSVKTKHNNNLILAMESKIATIIKEHNDPVKSSKLIMELIWVTRDQWKGTY